MAYCCVPFCKSDRKRETDGQIISFHEFPCDLTLRERWIASIARQDPVTKKIWIPSDHSTVCSLHFEENCFSKTSKIKKLLRGSIPSIFPGYPKYMITSTNSTIAIKRTHTTAVKDEPAALKDINDTDWAPTLFLGHNYFQPDKHDKGRSGNEIEDLLYDHSRGRKWHPLLEQKKYYEEMHSDEVIDIIEWRSSLEKKRLKASNIDSEGSNELSKVRKPFNSGPPVTIIYLRSERS